MNENNKLIAEFMKEVILNGVGHDFDQFNDLKYHYSWDWLMPVIKKCLNINEEENDEWEKQYENIDDTFYQVEIIQTYQAVIEFIKWYNKEGKCQLK